jgi:selenide,water dikinase
LDRLPITDDERLLVGTATSDDAGVYRLSAEIALVQTVDVFPPVINDPFLYGKVVAANSLSDCYAMGATPINVMNIIMYPSGVLDVSIMAEILMGSLENIRLSGASLVGGHTSIESLINYGLSVTGIVHPDKIVRNSTAKPGDVLFLTKPIGTGILATAVRSGKLPQEVEKKIALSMATLNKDASEAMVKIGVDAATDITGFGLMGHAFEMARASGTTFEIQSGNVPFFEEVFDYYEKGIYPGGSIKNTKYLKPKTDIEAGVSEAMEAALFDCQTSGGLLISISEEKADKLALELKNRNVFHAVVGRVNKMREKPLAIKK